MTDRLYQWPADDAPIGEWLKPVSALMVNVREATGYSGAVPGENTAGGGIVHMQKRMQERMRGRRRREAKQ